MRKEIRKQENGMGSMMCAMCGVMCGCMPEMDRNRPLLLL